MLFFYLAAYMLGLVRHIRDSSVDESQFRSSCILDFLSVLVLLVPSTNRILGLFGIFKRRRPGRGLDFQKDTSYFFCV